jgi:hypothetical protein
VAIELIAQHCPGIRCWRQPLRDRDPRGQLAAEFAGAVEKAKVFGYPLAERDLNGIWVQATPVGLTSTGVLQLDATAGTSALRSIEAEGLGSLNQDSDVKGNLYKLWNPDGLGELRPAAGACGGATEARQGL